MMHQVNYSQINQFCRITALCLWTVFHCMPLHHAFTLRPFTHPSKLRELKPDQHTQIIEKVGLRDRGRFGTGPEEPLLIIVRPAPKVLVPAFFFFFFLGCIAVIVRVKFSVFTAGRQHISGGFDWHLTVLQHNNASPFRLRSSQWDSCHTMC